MFLVKSNRKYLKRQSPKGFKFVLFVFDNLLLEFLEHELCE